MKNIKIEIEIPLNEEDYKTLSEQIEGFFKLDDGELQYNTSFHTKHLLVDFEDFLLPWIDQGYSFEWNKDKGHYIIY